MRYSMLVYLSKMGRTLLEASGYLSAAPADSPVRSELLENGRQMIGQIRAELERHTDDLRSNWPLESLSDIERTWESGGPELEAALEEFILRFPSEVHYQVRAVFFTGLGSTWDAMESVYEYMRDDPRFDPVVVLIPILRQVEKHGEMVQDVIFEDYLTPMGIPFLEYTQYSPEEDCPDLAFINQPYEGVTITEFWPETIAQYTRLVYLPYYLTDKVERESYRVLCGLPVYYHAWKAVCPNHEEYRYYCKHSASGGANGLLTGLPKLDHLVTLPERGAALPKGWECLEGKRVFLWNTWYDVSCSAAWLWFDEAISWFGAHEDCALIWRPHPMTDSVTKLHYPEIYPSYLKHIQHVRDMPNAVLDCSPSCEAAFYYSHAMVSDYSSMQPQYLLMDKPTLWVMNAAWLFTGQEFIESSWMEQTETLDGTLAFLEQIRQGEDNKAELRRKIRARDLPLADGHSGERVCEALWEALHDEDFA